MNDSSTHRYTFKNSRYSSHSTILRIVGEGNGQVLDVGCGTGYLSSELRVRGWHVIGIDNDRLAIQSATSVCDRVILADLNQLDTLMLNNEQFDIIVFGDVLEHLHYPLKTLKFLKQHLTPTGQMIISVPNIAYFWIRLNLLFGRFEYSDRGILDRTHIHFFTRRSLVRLLDEAELCVSKRYSTPAPLEEVLPKSLVARTLAPLRAISALLATLLPKLCGYQFVVVARPRVPDLTHSE